MPRARNIKPAFFSNDVLAALPALTRLLFVGLWTLADREGRLEDRPGKIKLQVLPLDDTDVDAALGELDGAGFIERYAVNGHAYIQVVNFTRHQTPHHREAASTIPPPPADVLIPDADANSDPAQGKPEARPRQDRLNPDTGYLIPDSPVTTATASVTGNKQASPRMRAREGNGAAPRIPQRHIRDALAAACYGRAPPELTPPERVWLDSAAADLAALPDATPAEIAHRVAHYGVMWPHLPAPSPRAVVANWTTLGIALTARDRSHETSGRTADDDAAFLAAFDAALAEPPAAALPPGGRDPRRPAP